jgi:hypothetical protein
LSRALSAAEIEHAFEIYDEGHNLLRLVPGALAVAGRCVVIQFPPSSEGDKRSPIERLRPRLNATEKISR